MTSKRVKRANLGDLVKCKVCKEEKIYSSLNFYPVSRGHTCKDCISQRQAGKRSGGTVLQPRTYGSRAMLGEIVMCNDCKNSFPYTSLHFYPSTHGHKCKDCVHRWQYERTIIRRAAARKAREDKKQRERDKHNAEVTALLEQGWNPMGLKR